MPRTRIIIYQEVDRSVPLLEWLDTVPEKVQDKCIEKIERLEEFGYDLRRPHCDLLRQGIYELRVRYGNVHYRILYAFVGKNIVLLSHGCSKIKKVAGKEIRKAVRNHDNYMQDQQAHTYRGGL